MTAQRRTTRLGLLALTLAFTGCQLPSMPWSDDTAVRPVPMPVADAPTRVGPVAAQPAGPVGVPPRASPPVSTGDHPGDVYVGEATHGALGRNRAEQLDAVIAALLRATKPAIQGVRQGLAGAVARVAPPQVLATNEAGLRDWRAESVADYQRTIDALYDVTQRQLENLHDVALSTAERQAVALAPPRTVLDDGPTGDHLLDMRMTALAEVLETATGLVDLRAEREQDRGRAVELIEVFNTFANPDAELDLDGRLLLFIGGDEGSELPRCVLAYRHDGPDDVGDYAVAQVVRHRVMRGTETVQDLGWRAAPGSGPAGFPAVEVHGGYLVAPAVQPVIDTRSPNFARLRDMRVVVDTQSAVIAPDGRVLAGVDWRVQFSISTRGALTWDISGGHPVYDPWCTHVKERLGVSADS